MFIKVNLGININVLANILDSLQINTPESIP